MLVEPDYRRYRIEVNAVAEGDRWNADVRLRRILSSDKPQLERVSCWKVTAALAEHAGMLWARRWIDLHADARA